MTNISGIGSGYIQGANTMDKLDAAKTAHPKPSETAATKMSSTAHDAASLSGTGSLLAAAASTQDVRAQKVESLRAAINDGTYHVAAGDLADTLMKSMLE